MQSDPAIGRYRRWYARLLHLYPRPFRQRFAEPMAQTFTDLCRERREANRGLLGFAVGTLAETSTGIMRENMTQLLENKTLRWVVITAVLLLVPLLAMVFRIGVPDPGQGTEGVNWGLFDFVIAGILILGAGLTYEFAGSRGPGVAHRVASAVAVAAGLFLIWANLAVGMIGDEGNPANLMYLGVLAVALIGGYLARLQPSGMAIVMLATAGAQALVAAIALMGGLGPELRADAFLMAAWVASGLLFRRATVAPAPSG